MLLTGFYDTQYAKREKPDCRGRVRSDKDGWFGYRAVVPVAYPIPGDVSSCIHALRRAWSGYIDVTL